MPELTPSTLETVSAHASGWREIYNTNFEKINTKIGTSIDPDAEDYGSIAVADAAAATVDTLTDNSGGTASTTIAAVSGTGDDTNINSNNATFAAEIAKLAADNASLRDQLNALLAALRITGGVGVLDDNP